MLLATHHMFDVLLNIDNVLRGRLNIPFLWCFMICFAKIIHIQSSNGPFSPNSLYYLMFVARSNQSNLQHFLFKHEIKLSSTFRVAYNEANIVAAKVGRGCRIIATLVMGWLNKIFKGSSHKISEGQYHGQSGDDGYWNEPSSSSVGPSEVLLPIIFEPFPLAVNEEISKI